MEDEEADYVFSTRQGLVIDPSHSDPSNPLRGVVLCCTSIPTEKRTELATQAEQMGAQHIYDLTSEVTHLIVGEYDTLKYRYVAKERPDVKVMAPSWIESVRKLWIEDHAIDIQALEKKHTLPTLAGLRICLTGFEDQEQRQKIINLVTANGAEYRGDLTKSISHLIVYRPEGAKFKQAKIWGMHRVSPEWLRDSLERGMILEEILFNPELPVEERGKGAWTRQKKSLIGKRSRDNNAAGLEEGKRKLRRTASTKLSGQNEKIWVDIVATSSTVRAAEGGEWSTENEERSREQRISANAQKNPSEDPKELSPGPLTSDPQGTFSDCQFYLFGFEGRKLSVLRGYLLSHEGGISLSLEDLPNWPSKQLYVVAPSSRLASLVPKVPESDIPIQVVTDWWIERCITAKSLVDPADYPLGRPFTAFPIHRFDELIVCSTGFEGIPYLHLTKAVALMGAKYHENFSINASVLICNTTQNMRREKLTFAKEWEIPIVSLGWLLDSIQKGERQLFRPYLQRSKKARTEPEIVADIDEQASTNEHQDSEETANDGGEVKREDSRLANMSRIDPTAFQADQAIKIESDEPPIINKRDLETQIPLAEVSPNSPSKTRSPSKESILLAPVALTPTIPQEAISTAITSLLAKSKPVTNQDLNQPQAPEAHEGSRKKRAPSRILGRAASNMSVSATSERASSVDSTASTGAAVIRPSSKSLKQRAKASSSNNSSLRGSARTATDVAALSLIHDLETVFMRDEDAGRVTGECDDQAPPQTQMQYVDPESSEYRARVIARIRGEKTPVKSRETVATIGNLDIDSRNGNGGGGPRTRARRGKV